MDGTLNSVNVVPMIMSLTILSSSLYREVQSVYNPAL
jgi:hypothetical protein